jgi:hypothetical protein
LSSNSNHKSIICHPIRRSNSSSMNLRRICSRQRHFNTILYISFSHSVYHCRINYNPSTFPPSNRLQ